MTRQRRQAILVLAFCILGAFMLLYGFWTIGWFGD